jgi:hypothetical protein
MTSTADQALLCSFLADIPKKDDGTQTSDHAGLAAWKDPKQMVTQGNLRRWQRDGAWHGRARGGTDARKHADYLC